MESTPDSTEVNKLNKLGYDNRLIDAEQTIAYAERALVIAKKINYLNGIDNGNFELKKMEINNIEIYYCEN